MIIISLSSVSALLDYSVESIVLDEQDNSGNQIIFNFELTVEVNYYFIFFSIKLRTYYRPVYHDIITVYSACYLFRTVN